MPNLDKQTKDVQCVISGLYDPSTDALIDKLNTNCLSYFAILHDQDTNEDGTYKTPHYHIVFTLAKRVRLRTFLFRLADILDISVDRISVMEYETLEGAVQYLIHQNNPEKYQYMPFEIISSFEPKIVSGILESDVLPHLTFSALLDIVMQSETLCQVGQRIGLGNYTAYRNVIADLKKEGYLGKNL